MRRAGFHHSEETKRKISLSAMGNRNSLGRVLSEEHKSKLLKINLGNKYAIGNKNALGYKHTEETKNRLSKSHKGMIFTKEHRNNIGIANKGEKCTFWKGGISTDNRLQRCSSNAKEWRLKVFGRDNYVCTNCNKGGYLEAHHIKPWKGYPELRFDINNGITFCVDCHKIYDRMRK